MSDKKWTPGPWKVSEDPYKHIRTDRGEEMDECVMAHDYFPDSHAHLIAAAPELYEALEVPAHLREPISEGHRGAIHALLAKARGEA